MQQRAETFYGICPIRAVILNICYSLVIHLPPYVDSLGLVPCGGPRVQDNAWHTVGTRSPCRKRCALTLSQPPLA